MPDSEANSLGRKKINTDVPKDLVGRKKINTDVPKDLAPKD